MISLALRTQLKINALKIRDHSLRSQKTESVTFTNSAPFSPLKWVYPHLPNVLTVSLNGCFSPLSFRQGTAGF